MRWLLACSLLLPLSAGAASVLLVPVDEKARVLAEELVEPFGAQKLTVKTAGPGSPAVNCLKDKKKKAACLTELGEKAKVIGVFVVSGALRGPRGVLTLELISEGATLKVETVKVLKGKVKAAVRAPVERLLRLLPQREADEPAAQPRATVTQTAKQPEPEPVADAPVKPAPVALTPSAPLKEELELREPAPTASKPKVGAWVMTGLAVVAAGTAATFGGLGLAGKNQLELAPGGVSALSYNDALALQQQSNTQLTVALGSGIGAGVSAVVAGILWGVE